MIHSERALEKHTTVVKGSSLVKVFSSFLFDEYS